MMTANPKLKENSTTNSMIVQVERGDFGHEPSEKKLEMDRAEGPEKRSKIKGSGFVRVA
jgi:hypothetical protein